MNQAGFVSDNWLMLHQSALDKAKKQVKRVLHVKERLLWAHDRALHPVWGVVHSRDDFKYPKYVSGIVVPQTVIHFATSFDRQPTITFTKRGMPGVRLSIRRPCLWTTKIARSNSQQRSKRQRISA